MQMHIDWIKGDSLILIKLVRWCAVACGSNQTLAVFCVKKSQTICASVA